MDGKTQQVRIPALRETGPRANATPAVAAAPSEVRRYLTGLGRSAVPDGFFRSLMVVCALSIFAIVALIAYELIYRSSATLHQFGWRFFTGSAWDPVSGSFGAAPFIYGTLISSLVALVIAVHV